MKISSGNYGFRFELPIPEIPVLAGELVSIQGFDVTVGKRIVRGGRKISYLEAPTRCPDPGWPFSFRDELKNGEAPSSSKLISCLITAR